MVKALFPLDGSDATYAAFEKGVRILGGDKANTITGLVVLSKGIREMPADMREHLEYDDEDELFIRDDEAKAVIAKAAEIAKRAKFGGFQGRSIVGKPKETILKEAKAHDLLVMHGLRASEREDKKHGNIVEELARAAPCSVLLIRT